MSELLVNDTNESNLELQLNTIAGDDATASVTSQARISYRFGACEPLWLYMFIVARVLVVVIG